MTHDCPDGRDPASFRDPSGYVFKRQGRVFRAIDPDCRGIVRDLVDGGPWRELTEAGMIVGTRPVDDPDLLRALEAEHPGREHFLEHDPVAPITYPYEWSFSMLADAALHTIDLQEKLLGAGYSLKDATAYNIQFVDGRPIFIDIPSIERPRRLDVWIALGQFGRMFVFPLLLFRHHGWDLRSYFLGDINGRDVEQVARSLGRWSRWRPRSVLDVALPAMLQRRASRATGDGGGGRLEGENRDPAPQLINLHRLRSKIRKLAGSYTSHSDWSAYTATCSYEDRAEAAKKALVARHLEAVRPARVLDIGCNTGDYSYIAARAGARVIAADADHDSVELLYRRLQREPAAITPVVLDLCNPSPAIGFMNRERPSFLERLDVDCVLALALIHHLRVSGNLPLPAVRDAFHAMTERHLILEFVPAEDVMFRRLTSFRSESFEDYTLEACRAAFTERFEIVAEEPVPESPRTLLFLQKRG